MTDHTLFIIAVLALLIVFLFFWVEYIRSDCEYGGSYNGKDNWLLKIFKHTIIENKTDREPHIRNVKDISDI